VKRIGGTSVALGPLTLRDQPLFNLTATVPSGLLRTLLLRGAVLWLLARLMGRAILAAGGQSAAPLLPAWVVVITASLTLVDLNRRKELALIHNLGVTTSHAVIMATLPAMALETALVMLVA
jgi:hypothetical protein